MGPIRKSLKENEAWGYRFTDIIVDRGHRSSRIATVKWTVIIADWFISPFCISYLKLCSTSWSLYLTCCLLKDHSAVSCVMEANIVYILVTGSARSQSHLVWPLYVHTTIKTQTRVSLARMFMPRSRSWTASTPVVKLISTLGSVGESEDRK